MNGLLFAAKAGAAGEGRGRVPKYIWRMPPSINKKSAGCEWQEKKKRKTKQEKKKGTVKRKKKKKNKEV